MSSADSPKADEKRIVDEALEVFTNYLATNFSCR